MSTSDTQLVTRNAVLPDMVALLRDQQAAKLDVVVPAAGLRSTGGTWEIAGTGPAMLDLEGVATAPGSFVPTGTCDAGMADKLGIPAAYLRRLRTEHLSPDAPTRDSLIVVDFDLGLSPPAGTVKSPVCPAFPLLVSSGRALVGGVRVWAGLVGGPRRAGRSTRLARASASAGARSRVGCHARSGRER